jgi:dihydrofolate reductase
LPRPGDQLHRHFNDAVRESTGMIYGRRMYEVMRYWDDDQPDWDAVERDFAAAWRAKPKWVVSRTLGAVGPNATLVRDDAGAFVRALKAKLDGEIDVAGPELAGGLTPRLDRRVSPLPDRSSSGVASRISPVSAATSPRRRGIRR